MNFSALLESRTVFQRACGHRIRRSAIRIWLTPFAALFLFLLLGTVAHASSGACIEQSPASSGCGLGSRWIVDENGNPGTWTRRGMSLLFDTIYPTLGLTTVNSLTVDGNKVYLNRDSSSDGNLCFYEGTLSDDGKTISGTYKCRDGGPYPWKATIICDSPSATPPVSQLTPPPDLAPSAPPPLTAAVTIPAGASILVRMIDSVDSSKNSVGDQFQATLESALVVGDTVVAPRGADVFGKLAQAKQAGHISGGAELTLELTGIRVGGNIVPIDSTTYDAVGKGRGKQSAGRIGGGAALGAIIGGIAGGGAGAAIGAGVGAAAGTTVQLVTHGEKIRIPSETLLEFRLENPVTVPAGAPSN